MLARHRRDMSSAATPAPRQYARRMFQLAQTRAPPIARPDGFFNRPPLRRLSSSIRRRRVSAATWISTAGRLAGRTDAATSCFIAFFYGISSAASAAVVDGIEPVDRPSDSIQIGCSKTSIIESLTRTQWVARSVPRTLRPRRSDRPASTHRARRLHAAVDIHETTLDGLIDARSTRRLLSNANTVIYMGKVREGTRFRRAMYVAKHRGSVCPDEILPYRIEEGGLVLEG